MSAVELGRAELVHPTEPWRLIKTDLATGQHEAGAPPFEIIGLQIVPTTVQKPTNQKEEVPHVQE
jgi:hypothetical protein